MESANEISIAATLAGSREGFGVISNGDTVLYERSTNLNINLVWGGVMLVFGVVFLGLARRSASKQSAVEPSRR